MSKRNHIRHNITMGRVLHMVMVIGTILIILAMVVALALYRPLEDMVDSSEVKSVSYTGMVDQTQLISYCPERMQLPDAGDFGDKDFQASSGDLASSARYGAFGTAYSASINSLGADQESAIDMSQPDTSDNGSVMIASGDADDGSRLQETRLLASQSGSGAVSAMASWATTGDLKGLAASPCVTPQVTQTLVLPDTQTGTSQHLVLANPSAKSTSVQLTIWGTSKPGQLTLSTNSTVTVKAASEQIVDLAAAAPDEDGLYVTVSSQDSPVAAVVRVVKMDGLSARGSEFVTASETSSSTGVLAGVDAGEGVSLTLFGHENSSVSLSWITKEGSTPITDEKILDAAQIRADTVTHVELGDAPEDALALAYSASNEVWAMAQVRQGGEDNQEDVSYLDALHASASAAAALPANLDAKLTLVNPSNRRDTATVTVYSESGEVAGTREVSLDAEHATRINLSDMAKNAAALQVEQRGDEPTLVWNVTFEQPDVNAASVAGIAAISPTSLEPSSQRIVSILDDLIVR